MKNLGEIFLTKIQPSQINFRQWVIEEDEETTMRGSISRKQFMTDMMNPKAKARFDLDMGGSKNTGSFSVPDILPKIDYTAISDSLKEGGHGDGGGGGGGDGGGDNGFDPFLISPPTPLHPQESKEKQWKPTIGNTNNTTTIVDGSQIKDSRGENVQKIG